MDKFDRHSNYDTKSSYRQIVFGHDNPLLEVELNEMQQLQEKINLGIIRKHIYSGFTELVQKEFSGEPIIYNPTANGLTLVNKIAIAPFKANVFGYEIDGQGNFTYNKIDNYILVDLGETTVGSLQDALVYLEVWFEIEKGTQPAKKYGYVSGDGIGTPAKDDRVGEETSRRISLCWNIQVQNECNFNLYPEGLGYKDIFNYSHVFAKANGQFGKELNVNLSFCEATNELFRHEDFHIDKNLYVAGRPTYEVQSSTLYGKYVFALPMFRIRRRNKEQYSLTNFNGSSSYNQMVIANNSSIKGDLLNHMRPDRLAYDVIDVNDVMDIRKSVNYADFNENSIADDTISQLFNNELKTKETKKMRRVQIGNQSLPHKLIKNTALVVPFEKSTLDLVPGDKTQPITEENTSVRYEDSICGMGCVVENGNKLTYNIRNNIEAPLLNRDNGTIDFYFKPYWNGSDEEVDQVILTLKDSARRPIITLKKKGLALILTHNNDITASSPSIATMNLSTDLIKANQYYYFRISWTNKPMPINGMVYLYVNGTIRAQAEIATCKLVANFLEIGGETNSNKGFLIEQLVGFKKNFEVLAMQGADYGYAKNTFFPMIPQDFMFSDTLLLPSFNGFVNNFGDNAYTQRQVTVELNHNEDTTNGKVFEFKVSSDKKITSIDKVYNYENQKLYTNLNYSVENNGNNVRIVFATAFSSINKIVVEMTLELSSGCGGQDLPTEILGAAFLKYDDEAENFNYGLNIAQEVSFNAEGAYPRQIGLLKPRKVNGTEDKAYDVSNKIRTEHQCYARLLYYNMSGNGTIEYHIPISLYGYKVVGVIGSSSSGEIDKVYRTPSEIPDEDEEFITVLLKQPLLVGETITFELATEGYSFDYDLESKTIMTNMCQCKVLKFSTDGKNSRFTIPCMSNEDEYIHGGILVSAFTFTNSAGEQEFQAYEDTQVFYNEYGEVDPDKHRFNARKVTVTGFGTPFITVDFGEILTAEHTVEIPIMTTYQPLQNDILSIWYNYIPYQGLMDTCMHNVKRITDWKYFITTLGTGKEPTEQIKKNIINNLPGGLVRGYKIDNRDIILKNAQNNMGGALANINKKLVFMNDYVLQEGSEFCNLITEYKIKKNCSNFQDGKIQFENLDFALFFDDCTQQIKKYIGAYCTVATDTGELMVLVVGNFNEVDTTINKLNPEFGDLYRIVNRPTTVRK